MTTKIENSSAATKAAIAEVAEVNNAWLVHQIIDLSAVTDVIDFVGIPASTKLVKIEGLLAGHSLDASAILPSMTLNNVTTSIYQWTKYDYAGAAPSPSTSASDNAIPFTSLWSGDEKTIFEAIIECDNEHTTRKAIHVTTSNTGGTGDFHKCGAFADIDAVISSVQIFDDFVSNAGFGTNTRLIMSVMN